MKLNEEQARKISLSMMDCWYDDWFLLAEKPKIVLLGREELDCRIYRDWNDFLDDWIYDIETDLSQKMIYLTRKEYQLLDKKYRLLDLEELYDDVLDSGAEIIKPNKKKRESMFDVGLKSLEELLSAMNNTIYEYENLLHIKH